MTPFAEKDVLVQLADPDHQPIPCSARHCGHDAVLTARLRVETPAEYALTACDAHVVTMIEVALHAAGEGDPQ